MPLSPLPSFLHYSPLPRQVLQEKNGFIVIGKAEYSTKTNKTIHKIWLGFALT